MNNKRNICFLCVLSLLAVVPAVRADPEADVSSVVADSFARQSVVGLWSGRNADGVVVSYLFEDDGSAVIFESEKAVLGGAEDGSELTWSYESKRGLGSLDFLYSNDLGIKVSILYAARFSKEGDLLLRSGGKPGKRPSDVLEVEDSMQIRLTRQY